jgi:hypothetical protein
MKYCGACFLVMISPREQSVHLKDLKAIGVVGVVVGVIGVVSVYDKYSRID